MAPITEKVLLRIAREYVADHYDNSMTKECVRLGEICQNEINESLCSMRFLLQNIGLEAFDPDRELASKVALKVCLDSSTELPYLLFGETCALAAAKAVRAQGSIS